MHVDKIRNRKINSVFFIAHPNIMSSCLLVKKTCLHVFLSKNMASCQDNMCILFV